VDDAREGRELQVAVYRKPEQTPEHHQKSHAAWQGLGAGRITETRAAGSRETGHVYGKHATYGALDS
jgi:hypothetical protein